jgi:alpha-1,3/alpha-1,6-mannosyltransferase
MAAKKPVIACNSGGPKESVVHNVTGFLCDPTDVSFAYPMEVLLNSRDYGCVCKKTCRTELFQEGLWYQVAFNRGRPDEL